MKRLLILLICLCCKAEPAPASIQHELNGRFVPVSQEDVIRDAAINSANTAKA
jgi:hypothetical protein